MQNLKELRLSRNLSQQTVANYLGVTRQAYSNYENGNRTPDYEVLLKLTEYFDTTVEFLLRGAGQKKTPTPGTRDGLDAIDIQISDIILKLTPAKKQEALRYLQYLEAREDM